MLELSVSADPTTMAALVILVRQAKGPHVTIGL